MPINIEQQPPLISPLPDFAREPVVSKKQYVHPTDKNNQVLSRLRGDASLQSSGGMVIFHESNAQAGNIGGRFYETSFHPGYSNNNETTSQVLTYEEVMEPAYKLIGEIGGDAISLRSESVSLTGNHNEHIQTVKAHIKDLLNTPEGLAKFAERIESSSGSQVKKLADSKRSAFEEIGLGVFRKEIADANLGSVIKTTTQELYKIVNEPDISNESIVQIVNAKISDLQRRGVVDPDQVESLGVVVAAGLVALGVLGKRRGAAVNTLLLASFVLQQCNGLTKTPEAQIDIDVNKQIAYDTNCGNSNLTGNLVDMVAEAPPELVPNVVNAIKDSGHFNNGEQYIVLGKTFIDDEGNRQPWIMVERKPKEDSDKGPGLFSYTGKQSESPFCVPPDRSDEGALIPMYASKVDDNKIVVGPAVDNILTGKRFTFELDDQGAIVQTIVHDPYSGQDLVIGGTPDWMSNSYTEQISLTTSREPVSIRATQTPDVATATAQVPPTPDAKIEIIEVLDKNKIKIGTNGQVSYEGIDVPGAILDDSGLHLQIGENRFDIPQNEVLKRFGAKEGSVVVYDRSVDLYNGTDTDEWPKVVAAFNPQAETERWKGWVEREKAISLDKEKPIIVGTTFAEGQDFMEHIERAFLQPYRADTVYPDIRDRNYNDGEGGEGIPPFSARDLSNNPFRDPVNFSVLQANEEEKRASDTGIITEQILNPRDRFDIQPLHFASGDTSKLRITKYFDDYGNKLGQSGYLLPLYRIGGPLWRSGPRAVNLRMYYAEYGYADDPDGFYVNGRLGELVQDWFNKGEIPEELQNIWLCDYDVFQ